MRDLAFILCGQFPSDDSAPTSSAPVTAAVNYFSGGSEEVREIDRGRTPGSDAPGTGDSLVAQVWAWESAMIEDNILWGAKSGVSDAGLEPVGTAQTVTGGQVRKITR